MNSRKIAIVGGGTGARRVAIAASMIEADSKVYQIVNDEDDLKTAELKREINRTKDKIAVQTLINNIINVKTPKKKGSKFTPKKKCRKR